MAKKEEQQNLPGIPAAPTSMFKVTFQYQGPNYALRAGQLVIPANDIQNARIIANGTLKDLHGDRWFNITKIQTLTEEAPF